MCTCVEIKLGMNMQMHWLIWKYLKVFNSNLGKNEADYKKYIYAKKYCAFLFLGF